MKKVLSVLTALFVSVFGLSAADAGSPISVTLDGGYNNYYVVDGLAYTLGSPYAALGVGKSFKYVDAYVGGVYLSDSGNNQTHWTIGLGKAYSVAKDFALRADLTAIRHQISAGPIQSSTELGAKLAVQNPYVTPYVRGAFFQETQQTGYFVGAYRDQKLFWGFVITPAAEWGSVTDYETVTVKGTLVRPFNTPIGVVTPYGEVGYYNNTLNVAQNSNLAVKQFRNETVYSAGVKFTF